MPEPKVFKETVTERYAGVIIASEVEEATPTQIQVLTEQYRRTGQCTHSLVVDEPGFLYDIRSCAICGQGLGTV